MIQLICMCWFQAWDLDHNARPTFKEVRKILQQIQTDIHNGVLEATTPIA